MSRHRKHAAPAPAPAPAPTTVLTAAESRRPPSGHRGVTVYLDVPEGSGFPDDAELFGLADVLHELAQDLVPGASARTDVTMDGPPRRPPGIPPTADVVQQRLGEGDRDGA